MYYRNYELLARVLGQTNSIGVKELLSVWVYWAAKKKLDMTMDTYFWTTMKYENGYIDLHVQYLSLLTNHV